MKRDLICVFIFLALFFRVSGEIFAQEEVNTEYSRGDTSYIGIADSRMVNMTKPGKPPKVTIALSLNYNIGHLDLASDDNAYFRKGDLIYGRNFGTRYGYGATLTGKFSLHKAGNVRLNVGTFFQRFQSNFVITESPEGRITYNVFGGSLGIENNFNPDKMFKPYIGGDIVLSVIGGDATLATDSVNFDVTIKNSLRVGAAFTVGFEYAFNNKVGMNLGYKLTYANLIGKKSKESSNPNETYLNDEKVAEGVNIPFAGWKQFVYSTFYAGINLYIGMNAKK